jgi:hypothetical protein
VQRVERGAHSIRFTTSPRYRAICATVLVGPLVVDASYRTATQGVDDSYAHWLLVPLFAFGAWLVAWRPMLELNADEAVVRWLGTYRLPWADVEDVVSYKALVAPQRVGFAHAVGTLHAPVPWARSKRDPIFDSRLALIREWWVDGAEIERRDVDPGDELAERRAG